MAKPVLEKVKTGEIQLGVAKVLMGIEEEKEQVVWAIRVIQEKLSVRKLESLLRSRVKSPKNKTQEAIKLEKLAQQVSESLQRSTGSKVSLQYQASGKGNLTFHFYSSEELNNLIQKINRD